MAKATVIPPATTIDPAQSTEMVRLPLTDWQLRETTSLEAAQQLFAERDEPTIDASLYIGSGSESVHKDELEDIPFLILQWTESWSAEYDGPFVVVHVLTEAGKRLLFSDGTKGGVRDQLGEIAERTGRHSNVLCPRGLRVSRDYTTILPDGKKTKGTSYYIG